ncbi:MAG: UDP-N-acetylglucosamine 2-epimerase (non-hydrolyzing) [Candidatus Bipolaricaulota bacterium]|nr:UDP-N-acetylglucosamine 2-epimerase (non-hydrolyzing) [Candidatus Bipolaricaulota bacterium]
MRVLSIFGTRPEAIKLAPVIRGFKKYPQIVSRVCVTAQHREMLDQVTRLFEIEPDWDLDLMQKDQTLFDITARGLRNLQEVLVEERPDIILVQGDTTTAFVASLAAFYLKVKVGHVEAGLRTRDRYNPFPEEMNRRLVDALSDIYFAPTQKARQNLLNEGISEGKIFITGNTVIDSLFWILSQESELNSQLALSDLGLSTVDSRLILVTGHRRESFGEGLENICQGLRLIAKNNPAVQIIYPVHLNPNVRGPVYRILGEVENVRLIEPLDYINFVFLMRRAFLILTDSGGIQEEAPSLGKPVLVMRENTERPEAIEAGTARLVGTASERIFRETQLLMHDPVEYERMAQAVNPFGDGKAAERIIQVLLREL